MDARHVFQLYLPNVVALDGTRGLTLVFLVELQGLAEQTSLAHPADGRSAVDLTHFVRAGELGALSKILVLDLS